MKDYTITFKDGRIQEVRAERFIDLGDRLILFIDHEEVARFMSDDISAIKESDDIPPAVYGNPSERRKRG